MNSLISNPPYNMKWTIPPFAQIQQRFVDSEVPPESNANFAFILSALDVSEIGYKLHARMIWDKGNGPAPAYTVRFSHEYLLWFFKKGKIILPDKDKRGAYPTVMRENSRRHSQKPECAYQMLETLFPSAKKLELFARTERDGWDQWGNEI